jgi:ABC-type transport system involved in multi-copper enzyme maturation permease subunit
VIRALLLRNVYQQRRLLPALIAGVFGMELLIVQIAAAFGPTMTEMFESLPPLFRSFVGAQLEELSLSAFIGFGFQHPAILAMALSLVVLTATVPAAERDSGMLDLLLARPVPRSTYFAATLGSIAIGAVVLPVSQLFGTMVGLATVRVEDEPAWTQFIPSALGQAALILAFGGLTLLFASGAKRRGPASSRAVAVILVLYVLEAFGSLYAPIERLSWLSLFHYFQPISSAIRGPSWSDPLILLAVFAVSTSAAFVRFERRDV